MSHLCFRGKIQGVVPPHINQGNIGRNVMSELLDKYANLKQELMDVRDEHRLHGRIPRECREENAILDEMDDVWHKMSYEEQTELDCGWDCCGGSLNYMARRMAKWSEGKGWITNWHRVPEKLMLAVTELSEAMEEYRCFSQDDLTELDRDKSVRRLSPEGTASLPKFGEEIADTIIRLLNLSASLGIDIETAIADKMAFNANRPYRHGGKNC
jgi:NTP pyrophosphatase (non-canonical NTP hydrolase)